MVIPIHIYPVIMQKCLPFIMYCEVCCQVNCFQTCERMSAHWAIKVYIRVREVSYTQGHTQDFSKGFPKRALPKQYLPRALYQRARGSRKSVTLRGVSGNSGNPPAYAPDTGCLRY